MKLLQLWTIEKDWAESWSGGERAYTYTHTDYMYVFLFFKVLPQNHIALVEKNAVKVLE